MKNNTPKIAILYIATGRYTIFWKAFYKSCEKYFLPDCEKYYFVFTDPEKPLYHEKENNKIVKTFQQKLGWPHDTLMRFDIFLKREDELKKMDYIFFLNANMLFIKKVTREILPYQEGLLGVLHPGFQDKPRELFTYDENPLSSAYISKNEGEHYFMGGFNGGKSDAYLSLIRSLDKNIKADLDRNIIALWHDESHLNRYFIDHPCKILSKSYGTPQKRTLNPFTYSDVKVIIRDKSRAKYGGHKWLRGETDKRKFSLSILFQKVFRCE